MAYDFIIVGANGLQGRIVSRDLIETGYKVLLCDKMLPSGKLAENLKNFRRIDLRNMETFARIIRKSDSHTVVNCAEGNFDLDVQKLCLKYKNNYLDLGSDVPMTKKQFGLHRSFERKKLCAITGCGSVPGIGNIMMAYATQKMNTVDHVEAGFAWKPNMKVFVAPFSIVSVIEEFTENPIMVEYGNYRKFRPRSGMHVRNFRWIGRQRVFLARHAEPFTFYEYLKNKKVKTIKFYAGFPEFTYHQILDYIETELGSLKPNENGIAPAELLADALRTQLPPEKYKETENLWVTAAGEKNGKHRIIEMSCHAQTIKGLEEHGCNIDTGLPCSIMAQMIREGEITAVGSRSPEFFVPIKPFFKKLAKRKMKIYENEKRIN